MKSGRVGHRCIRSACRSRRCVGLCIVVVAVVAGGERRGGERRLHERLAYVVRLDNRASVIFLVLLKRNIFGAARVFC